MRWPGRPVLRRRAGSMLVDGGVHSWLVGVDIPRAAEAKVMDSVACLEAAPKSVAHKRREITSILRSFRPAATKELAVQTRVATRIAGNHGGVEVGHPFPDEAVQIVDAENIGSPPAHRGKDFRRR